MRYTKAVQGTNTLYMLTRSWRTKSYVGGTPPIAQQQITEAVAFLSSSVVCADGAAHPCPTGAAQK